MQIKYLVFIIIGLLAGVAVSGIFKTYRQSALPVSVIKQFDPAILAKQQAINVSAFRTKSDSLLAINIQLANKTVALKQSLAVAKIRYSHTKSQLQLQADSLPAANALTQSIKETLQQSDTKDSLYQLVDTNVQAQLQNKDSLLQLKEAQYQSLHRAFQQSLAQQDVLYRQAIQYAKLKKKQRVKRRLLSTGLLLATGATAVILLHQ